MLIFRFNTERFSLLKLERERDREPGRERGITLIVITLHF
jgi:hypothetical protein